MKNKFPKTNHSAIGQAVFINHYIKHWLILWELPVSAIWFCNLHQKDCLSIALYCERMGQDSIPAMIKDRRVLDASFYCYE